MNVLKIVTQKNILFVFLLFVFSVTRLQAQVIIGSFSEVNKNTQKIKVLKVEYNENTSFIPKITQQHKGILYVSDDFSFYKTEFNFEKINAKEIRSENRNIIIIDSDDGNEYFSEIIVNRKEKILTEYLFEDMTLKKYFAVYEKQPDMKWELLEDEKQINDYKCKKAKTTFRGRTYEVWYTPEIPVSVGPWKFNGLPGLILSVTDSTDNFYSWEVASIKHSEEEYFDFQENINNKSKFQKISYQEFDEKFIEARKDDFKAKKARVSRDAGAYFRFDTLSNKEPINEWRTQTNFEF